MRNVPSKIVSFEDLMKNNRLLHADELLISKAGATMLRRNWFVDNFPSISSTLKIFVSNDAFDVIESSFSGVILSELEIKHSRRPITVNNMINGRINSVVVKSPMRSTWIHYPFIAQQIELYGFEFNIMGLHH